MPNPGKGPPQSRCCTARLHHRCGGVYRLALLAALMLAVLTGCATAQTPSDYPFSRNPARWNPADLLALDPADSASGFDLAALYARQRGGDGELRLDFLDLEDPLAFDVYVALDYLPGGGGDLPLAAQSSLAWDACLVIRANHPPFIAGPGGKLFPDRILRVVRDAIQDSLIVRWNTIFFQAKPGRMSIEVYLTAPGSRAAEDVLGPVSPASFPTGRAPLVIAFWDTLPADTPAQALRRWDGAHTGPLGGRHGLRNVIQAAANYRVPVFLLDLKTPASLAALDALGSIQQILSLAGQGLLNLPDVYPGGPGSSQGFNLYTDIYRRFGFHGGSMLYGAIPDVPIPGYDLLFAEVGDPYHLLSYRGERIVPLPVQGSVNPAGYDKVSAEEESTPTGLPASVRSALLQAALSPDPADLVILGGSLPQSSWGDVAVSQAAMEYIATHPWIQPLDAAGLQAFPTRQGIDQAVSLCPGHLCPAVRPPTLAAQPGFSPGESTDPLTGETFLLEQLTTLPESRLAETAWLAFTNLTRAAPDPVLKGLRENYLGQLYGLILGAKWAENPSSQSRCDVDADLDGMPECILASETVFTIIDPAGARITFAFAASQDSDRNGGKPVVHQMIGPASQFSVGISDPATWDLAGGPSADPNEIPGAFTDSPDPFRLYHPTVGAGLIRFTSLDGTTVKEMRLLPGSLAVQYVTSTPLTSRIPLAVDPGAWFQPGGPWLFLSGRSSLGWSWGLPQHPRVEMRSTAPLHWMTSRDSAALLSDPEDPNLDYPPGHFLPFPLALVEMEVSREASLELHFW